MAGARRAAQRPGRGARSIVTIRAGDVWRIPVPRFGHVPAVVARAPGETAEVDLALLYVMDGSSMHPLEPRSIPPLVEWPAAWIGLVNCVAMRRGRWVFAGAMPGFREEEWPYPPSRRGNVDMTKPEHERRAGWGEERWSLETGPDEPSMLVVSNEPVSCAVAMKYPDVAMVSGPSMLEKALYKRLRGTKAGFWDMELQYTPIAPERVAVWRARGREVRARDAGKPVPGLPAGVRTDRALRGGEWLSFPMLGGGFGVAMLVEKPPAHLRFMADAVVMSVRRRWDRMPSLEDVAGITADDGAKVGQTSMICVRDGRWRVLGRDPSFDPGQWPWPRPWHVEHGETVPGRIQVAVGADTFRTIDVDPRVLALDPHAGAKCRGSSSYRAFESMTDMILRGFTYESRETWDAERHGGFDDIVTPRRIAAWKAINTSIAQALAAHEPSKRGVGRRTRRRA